MDEQLTFIRQACGPLAYIWISSIASSSWAAEVEFRIDGDKLKLRSEDKPLLSEAIDELYEKVVRLTSRLPEYDARKQIEHQPTGTIVRPGDDEIPF